MPGPAPKHPSTRARRNNPKAGFTSLSSKGRRSPAPAWPLLPDATRQAQKDLADDRIAALTAELAETEDGRTKGRVRRRLAAAEQEHAVLTLQLEQQGDMEAQMWAMLWSTPQALMWDASPAFERMLAQFVRWSVKGEQGDLDAAKEARIRGKEFGLTPLTLLGLKAEIERVDEAEDKGRQRRSKPARTKKNGDGDDPRSGLYAVS